MLRTLFSSTKNILTYNVVQSNNHHLLHLLTFNVVQSNKHHVLLPFASSFSSLPDPSFAPPPPPLVNSICRILSDFRSPHHDIQSALNPFAPQIDPMTVEHVLKRCKNLGFSAHRFFIWAQNLPKFKHTQQSFHILVTILGVSKQFPLLWDFLAEIKTTKLYEIDFEVFLLVFKAYSKADLPVDAIRAYNKMVDFGLKPNVDVLDELLFSLCQRKHVKHAQEFFDRVKDDFVADTKSYNILINGWGKIGQDGEARRLYDEMLERGCSPDLITFNSMLDCLCKGEKVEDAYKLFTGMESLGLKPDADTYSVFIHASCEAYDIDSVYKILDRMKRYKLVPDVATYNVIIKTLCKRERIDDAYKLFSEMVENGVTPNVYSYNAILAFHAEHSEVNGALGLLSKMDKESCKPNGQTYKIVLKVLIRMGRFDMVEEVWDTMEKRGYYPSVSTYAVMVHGFLRKKGKAEEACKYFEIMIDEGLPPYVTTCNLLRHKLILLGYSRQTDILAEKMERSTSRSIQELSSIMRGNSTSVVSQNEELYNGSDYSD